MSDKLKHTPWPWEDHYAEKDCLAVSRDGKNYDYDPGNHALSLLAPTAPHECSDPACPGNVNRHKLAAFEKMRKALEQASDALRSFGPVGTHTSKRVALAFEAGIEALAEAEKLP